MITKEASTLLFTAGTKTIRLGYERNGEKKIGSFEFETAAKNLYHAGFTRSEIGAYLLVGLSDSLMDVKKDADFISKCGLSVHLNQLSPVPGSRFYETVMDKHPEIEQEPLLQNDSSFIFTHLGFDYAEVAELKEYVRSLST
jgi:radical SAM superfamily enzyme YgiQ (UPF0313 family)